jgi:uncharacterized protein (TIGR02271 family)
MNLRTLILTGPKKVNELFAKLSETSDGAVKTREKLFAEIKTELELYAGLEEQHLFPILRRNPETKEIVAEAIKDNRELRAKLAELEALPKNDESFLEKLKELQKAFRQHARDDKREFLPAVERALSGEQVQDVAEKMETSLSEAEQVRQNEADERRANAREEREAAQQAEFEEEERAESERRARQTARQVADAALKPVEVAAEAADQVARLMTSTSLANGNTRQRSAGKVSPVSFIDLFLWPWIDAMQGFHQAGSSVAPNSLSGIEEVIPLGEEVLEVSKRSVNRGTARIRRYVTETPVEKHVTLQSEKVIVERRKPVTDTATGEIMTELFIEVTETDEVPVVAKRARVREEIVVRLERTQRVETVQETVRRDEVEIQQAGRRRDSRQLRAVTTERKAAS